MADMGAKLNKTTDWLRKARSRLAVAALTALWATPAAAVQYESEIDIETEQDLYDLQLEGEISEATLETRPSSRTASRPGASTTRPTWSRPK